MRYSDKRLRDDFTVHVLFSEPLQGTAGEIVAAAAEDYPGLDWSFDNLGPDEVNTRSVTLAVDFQSNSKVRGMTRFTGHPGPCLLEPEPIVEKSKYAWRDPQQARDVMARHTDYLSVSVASPKDDISIAARFDAARRATCLSAVLAKLPIALGVYFPSADLLMPPETWAKAAETAMTGKVPVLQWVNIYANHFQPDETGIHPVTVGTIGMAAFNGHEIVMPMVRIPAKEAAIFTSCAVSMLLDADHEFGDGNTMGFDAGDKACRIRHVKEGTLDLQTDAWMLFHTSSGLDDEEILGERALRPPPPGVDNSFEGDFDTLKNRLYEFVARSA